MINWFNTLVEDPKTGKPSSARLAALGLVIVGCVVALRTPEHSGTVSALIVGGAVALLTRTKTEEE